METIFLDHEDKRFWAGSSFRVLRRPFASVGDGSQNEPGKVPADSRPLRAAPEDEAQDRLRGQPELKNVEWMVRRFGK